MSCEAMGKNIPQKYTLQEQRNTIITSMCAIKWPKGTVVSPRRRSGRGLRSFVVSHLWYAQRSTRTDGRPVGFMFFDSPI